MGNSEEIRKDCEVAQVGNFPEKLVTLVSVK